MAGNMSKIVAAANMMHSENSILVLVVLPLSCTVGLLELRTSIELGSKSLAAELRQQVVEWQLSVAAG
jgi:hypothetical protein